MKITQSTAMSIVTEMKKIIGEDLTFMDTTCHIIACTDPMRIGDYHGGSERMLRDGLKEMSVPDDNTYAGTRSGINLTLELDGVFTATGYSMWHPNGSVKSAVGWTYAIVGILIVAPIVARKIYKKTNNPYLAGIINSILVAIISCTSTSTILFTASAYIPG